MVSPRSKALSFGQNYLPGNPGDTLTKFIQRSSPLHRSRAWIFGSIWWHLKPGNQWFPEVRAQGPKQFSRGSPLQALAISRSMVREEFACWPLLVKETHAKSSASGLSQEGNCLENVGSRCSACWNMRRQRKPRLVLTVSRMLFRCAEEHACLLRIEWKQAPASERPRHQEARPTCRT
ncbi:hypothetical protein K437DRAFT_32292 [Tilletiaria anomala UBC 951]|uniref:Uncharacterized protein n=1 Tax=Tilletiaria anomala (strain ATCC 24038 / CBS 436.72 / UBC 951) TaxID=1037660 RepID=A0A066VGQ0_TILAU|nr:uncharacterized protein K437DRAFT_32292 [Tilletiaria anomala UBC 951]KDN37919.1 hypothetical protein K437DRAFT_32292 [Tilletiaria anomala UBC 951]